MNKYASQKLTYLARLVKITVSESFQSFFRSDYLAIWL